MPKRIQKGEELKNDDELTKDRKNKNHNREQTLLDAITRVGKIAIYVIPISFFIGLLTLSVILFFKDSDKLISIWKSIMNFFIAFVFGWFLKNLNQKPKAD